MVHYTESDCNFTDKVKVVLDLSNYDNKKKLEHATGVGTSDLGAKKTLFL